MSHVPRKLRNPTLECSECHGAVVKKRDDGYVCVDCGKHPTDVANESGVNTDRDLRRKRK